MCLITEPILLSCNSLIQISPIKDTIFALLENALSPIIELDPFDLTSRTGKVLIFIPIAFNNKDVLLINFLYLI